MKNYEYKFVQVLVVMHILLTKLSVFNKWDHWNEFRSKNKQGYQVITRVLFCDGPSDRSPSISSNVFLLKCTVLIVS